MNLFTATGMFTVLPPPPPKVDSSPSAMLARDQAAIYEAITEPVSQYQSFMSPESEKSARYDSESTLRGNNGSSTSGSGSDSSFLPPPAPVQSQRASFGDQGDNYRARNNDEKLLPSMSVAPPAPTSYAASGLHNSADLNMEMSVYSRIGSPALSDETVDSGNSVSSALNFLDSTLLSHTGSFNAKSSPLPTTPEDRNHNRLAVTGSDDDYSPMPLSSTKSKSYGSYTDLSKDSPAHMPVIMGDSPDLKSTPKKKGFLAKLKNRFLSSGKNKPEDQVDRDSKGRTIVHFTHEKVKTSNSKSLGMRAASSIPNMKDIFTAAKEPSLKRTTSLDEQSLRAISDTEGSFAQAGLVSPPPDWRSLSIGNLMPDLDNRSQSQSHQNASTSDINKIILSDQPVHLSSSVESLDKGGRRFSTALATRRGSKTSPPLSPAPPPPVDILLHKTGKQLVPDNDRRSVSNFIASPNVSVPDDSADEDQTYCEISQVKSHALLPKQALKPPILKKPTIKDEMSPNPRLSDRYTGNNQSSVLGHTAGNSSLMNAPDYSGSVSSSSTFSGFDDELGNITKESVARRHKDSKLSLMKFDFPPPPPGDESSGDNSSDRSIGNITGAGGIVMQTIQTSNKSVVQEIDGKMTARKLLRSGSKGSKKTKPLPKDETKKKLFNGSPRSKGSSPKLPFHAKHRNSNASLADSDVWGSEFSTQYSTKSQSPSQADLADPKLRPFSVALDEMPKDFRLQKKHNKADGNRVIEVGAKNMRKVSGEHNFNTATARDDDTDSWGSEFSEFKDISDLPDETNVLRPQDMKNPKLQAFDIAQDTTLKSPAGVANAAPKYHGAVEAHSPVKVKTPLFNIFVKKEQKHDKKSKEKSSKFAQLFHTKKHAPRDQTPYINTRPVLAVSAEESKNVDDFNTERTSDDAMKQQQQQQTQRLDNSQFVNANGRTADRIVEGFGIGPDAGAEGDADAEGIVVYSLISWL